MTTARIYTENGHQIIRLPDGTGIADGEVSVKRVGRSLMLVPEGTDAWQLLVASLDEFSDDYLSDREQPVDQERPSAFE